MNARCADVLHTSTHGVEGAGQAGEMGTQVTAAVQGALGAAPARPARAWGTTVSLALASGSRQAQKGWAEKYCNVGWVNNIC